MRWFASWCLFVVVASLLLLGCKTSTAADVEAPIPFEVLDTGREPRTLLRYSIADGTTTTSTTTFLVSESLEIRIDSRSRVPRVREQQ